ncbi:hypothetical protein H4S07_005517 [Coemansia furcata]|uniref:Uncharacterized protein n=1 Tax=Coemansia furcata TaxID=417177 RepID=A0ACC1L286_9FUNG|nr:hypothetical protein H4S07_005517 [Coemansia furcata]
MTGLMNSGAVLTGKRRRADSCDATAASVADGGQHTRKVKRYRSRTQYEEHNTHWKPVPHPDIWPVGYSPSTVEPAEVAGTPGDSSSASHMHHDRNFSHHASRHLYSGVLATPTTSPPSQGVSSSIDDCEYEDMDQDMDEGDDESDIDPNSEYYHINMLLKRLHDEREMRRQQQRLPTSSGPGAR